MRTIHLTRKELALIDQMVVEFERNGDHVRTFLSQLRSALEESSDLRPHVHSIRHRVKDPEHLRHKLARKMLEAKTQGQRYDVNPSNLFDKINDLAGIRVLHLHTRQIKVIDAVLRSVLNENRYDLVEGPFARTWDDESRAFFRECGIETQESPSMYTSVHYVVGSASRTRTTCEIQVRTLMEEVWGEVDHSINYPDTTDSVPCREQIRVLARMTSAASRLVDSIFSSFADHGGGAHERRARK